MKPGFKTLLRFVILGIIFPLVIHYTVYFRFTPNYLPHIYSVEGFNTMYSKSVFKYRVVGIKLQLYVYEKLKHNNFGTLLKENKVYNKRLLALDPNADELFYISYFIINTLSCIVGAVFLLLAFEYKNLYSMSDGEKSLTTAAMVIAISVTQFVVTPYDNLSYAFMIISFFLFLIHENKRSYVTLILLSIGIFTATLIRESSLLILCAMVAIYFRQPGYDLKLLIRKMWLPSVAFLAAYGGVRIYLSGEAEVAEALRLIENVNLFKSSSIMIALLFAVSILYLLWQYAKSGNSSLFKTFMVVSSPYLVAISIVGLLIEFRLWIPFVIGTLLLCKLDIHRLSSKPIPTS